MTRSGKYKRFDPAEQLLNAGQKLLLPAVKNRAQTTAAGQPAQVSPL